ncbi:hypothetical protein F7R12_10530 [Pseudomonas tolaasii]|nr:hypothetical protein F7R12_10530 [Pseudomonas tolaasii]
MWRGSLLPLGHEVAPKQATYFSSEELRSSVFRAATQPSGSKLPRHNQHSQPKIPVFTLVADPRHL